MVNHHKIIIRFNVCNVMSKVTIKSANTDAQLEFSEVGNEYFTVTLSSASLSTLHRVWVYTGDCKQIVSLFMKIGQVGKVQKLGIPLKAIFASPCRISPSRTT